MDCHAEVGSGQRPRTARGHADAAERGDAGAVGAAVAAVVAGVDAVGGGGMVVLRIPSSSMI